MLPWKRHAAKEEQVQKPFWNLSVIDPRVTVQSDREVLVEGCHKLLVYHQNLVCIGAKQMELSFWGSEFLIHTLSEQTLLLTGRIERVEFARR